jgi:hypothetical protein
VSRSSSLEALSEEDAGVFQRDDALGSVPGPAPCRAVDGLEGPREDVADGGWCGADRRRFFGDPDADWPLLSEVSTI